jgi:hypothetical protein
MALAGRLEFRSSAPVAHHVVVQVVAAAGTRWNFALRGPMSAHQLVLLRWLKVLRRAVRRQVRRRLRVGLRFSSRPLVGRDRLVPLVRRPVAVVAAALAREAQVLVVRVAQRAALALAPEEVALPQRERQPAVAVVAARVVLVSLRKGAIMAQDGLPAAGLVVAVMQAWRLPVALAELRQRVRRRLVLRVLHGQQVQVVVAAGGHRTRRVPRRTGVMVRRRVAARALVEMAATA